MGQTGKTAEFPRRFGKYTLLAHLATGGMADVFLARHLGPAGFEKECVIKRILPHLAKDPNNQAFIDMFLDEARIAARLSHPNIVHIFDLGQVDGDYFLALEYIDGLSIESILERTKQTGQPALPWSIAVRLISNVAEGLEHVHKAKDSAGNPLLLVHRDISPSNIMVSWDGGVKILDFGIAKATSVGGAKVRTGVGIIKGKVPYMSPEQIQGMEIDARSDIFSLAAVLYEITTGQRPFPGDTTGQLTVQITSREPNSPEIFNPGFPRDLWPILLRALAKSVDQRYQSARDFKLDLEQFLSDQHAACTTYDVEAYLRELVPERPHLNLPSPEEIARVESEAQALAQPEPPTPAPAALSDGPSGRTGSAGAQRESAVSANSDPKPAAKATPRSGRDAGSGPGIDVLEEEKVEERRRKQGSGSSGVVMIAIALLVVGTAVIFYLLHERALEKSATPPSVTDLTATPPPSVDAATAAPPDAKAAAKTGETPTANAATPAGTEDKKPEDKKAEDKKAEDKADKPEKKAEKAEKSEKSDEEGERPKRKKRHEPQEPAEAPHSLPLPPPPPADPE